MSRNLIAGGAAGSTSKNRSVTAPTGALRVTLVTVLIALLAGCATGPPPTAPIPSAYRVGAPDKLHISVLPDPVLVRVVTVRPDGYVTFDLIGDVRAAGRTTTEIAQDIEKRIARFKRDARATVAVEAAVSDTITIFGEVGRQTSMPLPKATRVASAIASVGGTGFLAWNSRIRVIRTDGETTTVHRVNLAAIQRGDLSTNMLLQNGDIVVVPPSPIGTIGKFLQQLTFPFTTLMGPGMSAANLARSF